jgi:hypothetical protein
MKTKVIVTLRRIANMRIILLSSILLFLLPSCETTSNASSSKTVFIIEVDAYGNENFASGRKYIIATGDALINESDLQYLEFAEYIKKTLAAKGYAETSDPKEANLFVSFKYGISDPKIYQSTVSKLIWGQTGVSSTNTTGTVNAFVNPYGGNATYSQTTTNTPTYGITGARDVTETIIKYLRYLTISVYDLDTYAKSGKEKIVWSTSITSTGSSGDIRRVFPYLIVAGQTYFGKSSGEKIVVKVYEGDQRVTQLKGASIAK